ncbi:MAG: protein kinase [Anaerolineae bacterium]|nr:protein kinase [Anaerolineae bacterium]
MNTRIGKRYELQERLGEGGMGAVYRAYDRLTGQWVALKRLNTTFREGSAITRLSLAQEFQVLASLRHPQVIDVLDYGFDSEGRPYYVMTLIPSPRTLIEAATDCDFDTQIRLFLQALEALAYLHRRGIIHRDLKPDNVLVTLQQQVKVVDFGVAHARNRITTSQDFDPVGTLAYMSPEAVQSHPVDERSDLYAMGVILYQILTGKHPYQDEHEMLKLVFAIITKPVDLTEIPPKLQPILARLMTKTPEERYPSADEALSAIYQVLERSQPPENLVIRESLLQTASLVGRDDELSRLTSALDQILDVDLLPRLFRSVGSAWLIGGESGVGKTRLLNELRIRALISGVLVLHGQGIEGGGLPYQLWRDPIRRLVISVEIDDEIAGVLREIVPDIETLLGRTIPLIAPLHEASEQQTRLITAILRVFRQYRQPILLLLEDLQWLEESVVPLQKLITIVGELPLLIVGNYRSDDRPDLPQLFPTAHQITLERLTRDELAQLAIGILGEGIGQSAQLLDLLQRETEGNVFFVIEVLRALAEESGRLSAIGQQSLPTRVTAGGIQQILQNRLQRVPSEGYPLLIRAAIAGRRLDLHLLPLLNNDLPIDEWITACANAAVLTFQNGYWQFAHDKLRETMIKRLNADEFREVNRLVAEAIETAYPNDEDRAVQLVKHWGRAQNPEKERHYTEIAARIYERASGHHEALQMYERLQTLIPVTELDSHARIYQAIGEIQFQIAEYYLAEQNLTVALGLARQIQAPAIEVEALLNLGRLSLVYGKFGEAEEHLQAAFDLVNTLEDAVLRAKTLNMLGTFKSKRGDLDTAERYQQEALNLTRTLNHPTLADALHSLATIAYYRGDLPRAMRLFEEAIQLHQQFGNRSMVGKILGNLGIALWSRGQFAEAKPYVEQAIAITTEIGEQVITANNQNTLGYIYLGLGDVAMARQYFREALHKMVTLKTESLILDVLGGFAQILELEGQLEEAGELLGLALSHPAATVDVEQTILPIINRIHSTHPEVDLEAALMRGRERDFDQTIAGLLQL